MSYAEVDESLFAACQEHAQEWQGPAFFGDFYRETDNVCRGVTLPQGDVPGALPFKDFGGGDFYQEPDRAGFGFSSGMDMGFSSSTLLDSAGISTESFMPTDFPPPSPTDSFFKFEMTTLYVTSTFPYEIGNHLLDFLGKEAVSTITKMRRAKFSIKADVFVDSMMCSLKIRVYRQESGQFAIEVQRRSGDTISFNVTFQKLAAYLKPRLYMLTDAPDAPAVLFHSDPLLLPQGTMSDANFAPLFDLAGLVGSPGLQAEASACLSKMTGGIATS